MIPKYSHFQKELLIYLTPRLGLYIYNIIIIAQTHHKHYVI